MKPQSHNLLKFLLIFLTALSFVACGSSGGGGGGGSSSGSGTDLAILNFSVDPSPAKINENIELTATIRNGGDATSIATNIIFYRLPVSTGINTNGIEDLVKDAINSDNITQIATDLELSDHDKDRISQLLTRLIARPVGDSIISFGDLELTIRQVPVLGANATNDRLLNNIAAPSIPGEYYYGACIRPVSGDAVGNNCRVNTVSVVVPNLQINAFSVSSDTIRAGESITLSTRLRNASNHTSDEAVLSYFISDDETITASDNPITAITPREIPALAAVSNTDISDTLAVDSPRGFYYYGVCVSSNSLTSSVCSDSEVVRVIARGLDVPRFSANLRVIRPGDSITLTANVKNTSNSSTDANTLRLFRSDDITITEDDDLVATIDIPILEAEATTDVTRDISEQQIGTYYYGACVNNIEGDNCSIGFEVRVVVPDLSIPQFSASPSIVSGGDTITSETTINNEGGIIPGIDTRVRVYRSTDDAITIEDEEVLAVDVSNLAAGSSREITS
jgi:hypothetical protein